MFTKTTKAAVPGRRERKPIPSIVSSDLSIVGDLKTEGVIHIEGRVKGDITCSDITVGEGASVDGEIIAEFARIFGEVRGRIRADSVELAATARVHGDILHKILSIETGAQINGLCRNSDNPRDMPVAQIAPPVPPELTSVIAITSKISN